MKSLWMMESGNCQVVQSGFCRIAAVNARQPGRCPRRKAESTIACWSDEDRDVQLALIGEVSKRSSMCTLLACMEDLPVSPIVSELRVNILSSDELLAVSVSVSDQQR